MAGSGKSSLVSTLTLGSDRYVRADFIHTRIPSHLVYVARSLPRLMPLLASNLIHKPRMTWADFKLLAYVTSWFRFLERKPEYSRRIVILDQGPIYALVRLRAKELGLASSESFKEWWDEMLDRWADSISVVVWLDASDEVLIDRINERSQSHTMKGLSGNSSENFLLTYRGLFNEIVGLIESHGGPDVHRFDTTHQSSQEIAKKLEASLSAPSSTV